MSPCDCPSPDLGFPFGKSPVYAAEKTGSTVLLVGTLHSAIPMWIGELEKEIKHVAPFTQVFTENDHGKLLALVPLVLDAIADAVEKNGEDAPSKVLMEQYGLDKLRGIDDAGTDDGTMSALSKFKTLGELKHVLSAYANDPNAQGVDARVVRLALVLSKASVPSPSVLESGFVSNCYMRPAAKAMEFCKQVGARGRNESTHKDVVAFQNRNPIHRAHFELLKCAQQDVKDCVLLVHPTCGPTQPGDIDGLVRINTYEALREETEKEFPMFRWAYLPYSMKMAGPREAIQHMIIRKNYGATHFIIGRDMAGTKSTIDGEDFYGAYDAQETGKKYSSELGVTVTHYENMVYVGPNEGYVQESIAKKQGYKVVKLSGTEFRRRLRAGEEIPEWFAFKSVVDILRKAGDSAFC